MSINLEEMQDMIIRKYGFEDENTIHFCQQAEKAKSTDDVKELFSFLMLG